MVASFNATTATILLHNDFLPQLGKCHEIMKQIDIKSIPNHRNLNELLSDSTSLVEAINYLNNEGIYTENKEEFIEIFNDIFSSYFDLELSDYSHPKTLQQ